MRRLSPLLLLLLLAPPALGQDRPPHVPTDEEADQARTGIRSDEGRGYQQRSVETVQSWLHEALGWMRDLLRRLHLTPARLCLGLGVVGAIWTAGKNKRKVRWAVTAGLSYLLAVVGLAAMVFNWPHFN